MANMEHVSTVKNLYAAFGGNDRKALLDCLSDDVTFELPAMPGVPFGKSYQGKDGVLRFLADREPLVKYERFDAREFFSDREHVIVLGETGGTVLTTGKPFAYRWVQLFEFASDGRVRRFHEFLDTHALVSSFA